VFSQGMAFAVQLIATVVLARILVPSDFGVVAMVTTFSLLLMSFGLNGFTEAILQRDDLDSSLASNLFWANLSMGSLLTVAFALSGPLLARFFGNPHVARVTVGMSATIFLSSSSVLHLALLKRAMRFTAVSVNAVVAQGVSVFVSVVLGLAGWGYWALVAGCVALQLSATIGAWIMCRWTPSLPRMGCGTGSMVRFAMNVYSHFIVNYSAMNLDNLLVGWRFNAQALGFYKKAFDLFFLPANQLLSPVGAVAVSALSRLKHDSVQYRRHFLSGLSVVAFVGMAVGADLALVGHDLIRLILGPGWGETGRIFRFFGPGIGLMLIYGTHGWLHLSIGKADRWFRWGIIELAVTSLLFVLALRWGPVGIAGAWTASFWILLIPAFWYAGRPIEFGVAPVLGVVWRYFLASLLAAGASVEIVQRIPSLLNAAGSPGAASRLALISTLFTALYLASVSLLHGGFAPLRRFAQMVQEIVPWRRNSSPREAVPVTAGPVARTRLVLAEQETTLTSKG